MEPTAHPDVLSEVKYFSHFKNFEIRFKDTHHNVMQLFLRHNRVKASFWNGIELAQHIPNVHKVYEIVYAYKAFLSDSELNVIFNLTNAEALKLSCDNFFNLSPDLAQRIAGIKNMIHLKEIVLEVAAPSDLKLQLSPFVTIPPVITRAMFVLPTTMVVDQRVAFAKNQKLPRHWKLESDHDVHWIALKKQ